MSLKYYVEPLGCAKNQVDAETMMACLDAAGAEAADGPEDAALIIVNSCGFIEDAKRETINTVLEFRRAFPDKKIILSGCLARRYADELREDLAEADAVFADSNVGNIAPLVFALASETAPTASAPKPPAPTASAPIVPLPERVRLLSAPGSAYVRIADGCDNRCSFCAIPLIRGPLVSRPPEDIIAECRALLKRGIVELCLVAQDLASYGTENGGDTNADTGSPLAALLDGLSAIPGRFWVRLLYLHPDRFPLDILGVMARDARFLPYFDIPFQHAAPSLLRAMGRRGDRAAYLGLIAAIRAALPDAVIRSTFMTGFPGETDADFDELLRFQDEARLDWLGVFAFSREEGVPAYSMPARPSRNRARERKRVLEERQMPISEARAERFVGRRLTALVEERTGVDGLYLGRLFCHAPEVDGAVVIESADPLPLGAFTPVEVTGRAGIDLHGHASPPVGFSHASGNCQRPSVHC